MLHKHIEDGQVVITDGTGYDCPLDRGCWFMGPRSFITKPKGVPMHEDPRDLLFRELLKALRDDVKISIGVNTAAGALLQFLESGEDE
jgi:hypothetical protein